MSELVLMADPRVSFVPVEECGDGMVDLREATAVLMDPRKADPDGWYALVRTGLAERLEQAAYSLPPSLRLLVVEAYRPPELQASYYQHHRERVAAEHPDLDDAAIDELTSQVVAPPEIAPHVAGAAVDVTLCRADGTELDLGTAVADTPPDSDLACYTDAPNIGRHARAMRSLLGDALSGAGLVNYPTEWWHWSYGDRYWAMTTGQDAAIYGPMVP